MKIVETILAQIGGISKPQQKFILVLLSTIFVLCGKVNFTNLSRYSNLSEKTYRRQFSKPFPFQKFNHYLISHAIPTSAIKIAEARLFIYPESWETHLWERLFFQRLCRQGRKRS